MIKKITLEEMQKIIDDYCNNGIEPKEQLTYCKEGDVFVGCDNQARECDVRDFKTEEEVIAWLNGLLFSRDDYEEEIEIGEIIEDCFVVVKKTEENYICELKGE